MGCLCLPNHIPRCQNDLSGSKADHIPTAHRSELSSQEALSATPVSIPTHLKSPPADSQLHALAGAAPSFSNGLPTSVHLVQPTEVF